MNVYDFDDTIYDGESVLDLFFFFIKRYPFLLRYLPRVLRVLVRYKAGKMSREEALREYVPLLKECADSMPGWIYLMEKFWDEHEKNIRPFYAELRRPDDVIVTAGPNVSMDIIARRLGVKNYICSEFDTGTNEVTKLCLREAKREAFLERFGDREINAVYTDSPKNDRWLIDMAKQAYLVRGNRIKRIK
ncbi:MAG: haloacid dehalogenase-like hydrolase [Clostridia bacterium]|nr:haloacid dehalogenase-like hydrolase [Clostridia bacterium]